MRAQTIREGAAGRIIRIIVTATIIGLLFSMAGKVFALEARSPKKPFPQHVRYTAGTIKPANVSQAQLDSVVIDLYNGWKSRFLVKGCERDQYYVWYNHASANGAAADNTISVSEGQAYGMLICVYMAGFDPDAQTYFDGLYKYAKDHRAQSSPYLMGWNQTVGCTNAPDGGSSTAADADMDIAYALLLGDKQWGSGGVVNYRQEAKKVIGAIAEFEMNTAHGTIMAGDWCRNDSTMRNAVRTSDMITGHFRSFSVAGGDSGQWLNAVTRSYAILEEIQERYAPATGLIPDFVSGLDASPRPALAPEERESIDGKYMANACRVPWRIGTDYLLHGDQRARRILEKINRWLRKSTMNDPSRISAGYGLDGVPESPGRSNIEFLAPLAVGAMADAGNQAWLNALWGKIRRYDYSRENYYGHSIAMLNAIVISGNWWAPAPIQAGEKGAETAVVRMGK